MTTTIQVSERTLVLLKKLKEQMQLSSYDEAIEKAVINKTRPKSMAGFLGKKYGKMSTQEILKDLRDKHDRF